MTYQTNKTKWDNLFNNSKNHVESIYNNACDEVFMKSCGEDEKEFYDLVKALLETEENPYMFLESPNLFSTWEGVSSLIHSLHHSYIDDGDHCFISCPIRGCTLTFYHPVNSCKDTDHEAKIDIYTKVHKTPPSGDEWEIHYDTYRFIEELKNYKENQIKKAKEFEIIMKNFKERGLL